MAELEIITRGAARAAGLRSYFIGKPCKHGHVAERYVINNRCRECQQAADAPAPDEACLPVNKTHRSVLTHGRASASGAEMEERKRKLLQIVEAMQPMTVRGLVEKTEGGYDKVQRTLASMRRYGEMEFDWIVDNTRSEQKPWCHRSAAANVARADAEGKQVYVYHFGDFDPSGVNAAETIDRDLRELAPGVDIVFERIAVTKEQIENMDLPTRPTKQSDTRAAGFGNVSVELDAIPPDVLREMVREVLSRHIDDELLEELQAEEGEERAQLKDWVDSAITGEKPEYAWSKAYDVAFPIEGGEVVDAADHPLPEATL